ncbi:hypothetical protein T484DRAFT_1813510 [Baffinella frigidus]|nr:hypothetical protein T484DRAFT_1813510 [Cryptophyta sp. CCMP2293]
MLVSRWRAEYLSTSLGSPSPSSSLRITASALMQARHRPPTTFHPRRAAPQPRDARGAAGAGGASLTKDAQDAQDAQARQRAGVLASATAVSADLSFGSDAALALDTLARVELEEHGGQILGPLSLSLRPGGLPGGDPLLPPRDTPRERAAPPRAGKEAAAGGHSAGDDAPRAESEAVRQEEGRRAAARAALPSLRSPSASLRSPGASVEGNDGGGGGSGGRPTLRSPGDSLRSPGAGVEGGGGGSGGRGAAALRGELERCHARLAETASRLRERGYVGRMTEQQGTIDHQQGTIDHLQSKAALAVQVAAAREHQVSSSRAMAQDLAAERKRVKIPP